MNTSSARSKLSLIPPGSGNPPGLAADYPWNLEPFVSADVAAKFLGIKRRQLLALARRGIAGAYPIGCGDFRKQWVFRLSELAAAIDPKRYDPL